MALRASPDAAEGLGYICSAGVNAALAFSSLLVARNVSSRVRLRWQLVAIACGFGTLAYLVAATGRLHFVSFSVSSPNMTWLFDLREASLLFAVLLVSRAPRPLLVLDGMQALLFVALRYCLTYWPSGVSFLANNHLIVTLVVSGFFCLMAWAASWAAADEEEHWSLRMFALICLGRFVQLFLADAVAYIWLRQTHGSAWDAVGSAVNLMLAFYLARKATFMSPATERVVRLRPSLLMRSLMPSFLAVGNILLALLALERSKWYTIAGVGAATCWYAFRVALVQRHALQESVKLHSRNRELEHIAGRDPLTQIGNRHSLALAFNQMVQPKISLRTTSLALILTDTDCFKQANDQYGHAYGDDVLVRIALILQTAALPYPESHCGRLGGDEFAVLLPNVDHAVAMRFAEQVRLAVRDQSMPAGEGVITLSVGVTEMAVSLDMTLASALAPADVALYRAKSLGRDRVEFNAARYPTAEPCLPQPAPCAAPLDEPLPGAFLEPATTNRLEARYTNAA